MDRSPTLDQCREALSAARSALAGIKDVLYSAAGAELGDLLSEVDEVAGLAAAARLEVIVEASRRGVLHETGHTATSFVRAHAPTTRQAGASQIGALIAEVTKTHAVGSPDVMPDPITPLGIIWDRVSSGEVGPPLALAALRELEWYRPRVVREFLPVITSGLLDLGVQHGPVFMRRLRAEMLAKYGLAGELDDEQDRLRRQAFLSAPDVESGDLTGYRMRLTPEQSAALEAAIGPLSKPQPNPETGERDHRPNGQRRAEALIEMMSRASSAEASERGGPAGSDACVYVTTDLQTLTEGAGAGRVIGSSAEGTVLSPEIVRRMSCDADLIRVVLGAEGELLDLGRTVRLFTRSQRRAIWHRDRTCTFPGCTAPGSWTKVHHVHHWADGGRTDIGNAALLCQRHHTLVHYRRLWAEVREKPDESGRYVIWDLTPGSYDYALGRRERAPTPWQAA